MTPRVATVAFVIHQPPPLPDEEIVDVDDRCPDVPGDEDIDGCPDVCSDVDDRDECPDLSPEEQVDVDSCP